MNGINENCHLILRDLYYYDIVAAFPTILKRQFYDFKDISLDNKEERSKYIGIQQIDNPQLSSFLNESVKNLIDYYIRVNEIKNDQIIFRQKDGIISTTKLTNNNKFIELKLRKILSLLIIDSNRRSMIYFDDMGELSVKGVPHYYKQLDTIYQKIFEFDFYNIKLLMKQMENLKRRVINPTRKDINLFGIEELNFKKIKTYTFLLKNNKSFKVRDSDYVNTEDIDGWKYFNHYFRSFFNSIFMEVMVK